LVILLTFGERRYISIWSAAMSSAVLPHHKSIGKKNYNNVEKNERKYQPILHHFEYLKNLGEVRATRVVAMLVDGMGGHANRDANIEVIYLLISMGYRSCYKRYMKALGYNVRTTATGGLVVTADDEGKEVDPDDYVSLPTYFSLWKRDFNNLKVSRPAVDICKDCYVFANRHRHLAHHTTTRRHDGDDICSDSSSSHDDDADVADLGVSLMTNVDLNSVEAASNEADEERELMLLQAAEHVKMARAQRALYQAKLADAVADANGVKDHAERRYTFVVDYGQNMELPVYNKEQPGITYYYSPLSIYYLGIVDHAHVLMYAMMDG
jgi:ribosome-binding protein aMBF1 (putative translation factor)